MLQGNKLFLFVFSALIGLSTGLSASVPMNEHEVSNVNKVAVTSDQDRERLQETAGFLGYYEIEAKKMLNMLDESETNASVMQLQTEKLMTMSENVIESARFRLPQCEEYLSKSLMLKERLTSISHAELEKDYHLDGALPTAPGECYHTKDLFVHPATVIVLVRDDQSLNKQTRESIRAEISEVLTHMELVRQLVIYE